MAKRFAAASSVEKLKKESNQISVPVSIRNTEACMVVSDGMKLYRRLIRTMNAAVPVINPHWSISGRYSGQLFGSVVSGQRPNVSGVGYVSENIFPVTHIADMIISATTNPELPDKDFASIIVESSVYSADSFGLHAAKIVSYVFSEIFAFKSDFGSLMFCCLSCLFDCIGESSHCHYASAGRYHIPV